MKRRLSDVELLKKWLGSGWTEDDVQYLWRDYSLWFAKNGVTRLIWRRSFKKKNDTFIDYHWTFAEVFVEALTPLTVHSLVDKLIYSRPGPWYGIGVMYLLASTPQELATALVRTLRAIERVRR